MMVKRYVVKDMPEAVMMIRRDLGKDAVILSTKKVSKKKWLGLWRSTAIEVVAAVGEDVPVRASASQVSSLNGATRTQEIHGVQPAQSETAAGFMPFVGTMAPQNVPSASKVTTVPHVPGPNLEATDTERASAAGFGANASDMDALKRELTDMKRLLELSLSSQDVSQSHMFNRLIDQGIERDLVTDILEEAQARQGLYLGPNRSSLVGHEDVEAVLKAKLGILETAKPIAASSRVVALFGPTGVGKTTTIAKLAALSVLAGRNVGLITTDTYRIAAVEQLKTYANILNVPLQVVYKHEEILKAYEKFADRDLVLIDTAGRNYRTEENLAEIRGWLSNIPVDETLLVISMASKPQDADFIASVLSKVPAQKFIFTKLDETTSYGTIINLLLKYKMPVSYFTTGQNVPDDIEIANVDKIVEWVVGGAV